VRRSFRLTILSLLLFLVPVRVLAQNGSVRAEVDARRVGVDDVVSLTIALDGAAAGADAPMPALKNLRVIGGPSTSTSISFVNGSMSRQKTLTFALRAEKTGLAEIGPVGVEGYAPTASITIEVVAGSIRPATRPADPFGDPFGGRDPFEEFFGRARRQPAAQGKLFVEANLSRPAVRVGEPILVTYYVYTQVSLSGVEFAEAPKYPGFWAEEVDRSRDSSTGANVSVQGEPFLRYPVLERLIFPTRTGMLEIPEARLRLVPAGGPFGVSAPIERSTKVLKVNVDGLPAGATDKSAVGSYEISAAVDRSNIVLGDAVTFRFTVKGRGNIKWTDAAPDLAIPGARLFPPRVISDLKTTRQGIEGSRTWEYVVVPEKVGAYEIPALPFSYFDPEAGVLKNVATQPIPLVVSPNASNPGEAPRNTTNAVSLRADLDSSPPDFTSAAFATALLALAAHGFTWRRGVKGGAAKKGSRANAAVALKELRDDGLLEGTKERAATRIASALEQVFGPRGEWPADDDGDRLRGLADDLEFLRFAPQLGSYDAKLREVRDRAIAIIETLA
jgi:hypothetical protein